MDESGLPLLKRLLLSSQLATCGIASYVRGTNDTERSVSCLFVPASDSPHWTQSVPESQVVMCARAPRGCSVCQTALETANWVLFASVSYLLDASLANRSFAALLTAQYSFDRQTRLLLYLRCVKSRCGWRVSRCFFVTRFSWTRDMTRFGFCYLEWPQGHTAANLRKGGNRPPTQSEPYPVSQRQW